MGLGEEAEKVEEEEGVEVEEGVEEEEKEGGGAFLLKRGGVFWDCWPSLWLFSCFGDLISSFWHFWTIYFIPTRARGREYSGFVDFVHLN